MRLTHLCQYGDKRKNREPLTKIRNKLFGLENIEDELGIDLVTLFAALSQGVYFRNGDRIEHRPVFLCKCDGKWALGYAYSMKYGLQGFVLETRKYKKHWALTKEELEDE